MGERAGFGGEPERDEQPVRVASFGGETFVEIDLHVGEDPEGEDRGWEY